MKVKIDLEAITHDPEHQPVPEPVFRPMDDVTDRRIAISHRLPDSKAGGIRSVIERPGTMPPEKHRTCYLGIYISYLQKF